MSETDFNLEEEYGYFLEKLVELLDEEVIEHYGVKGMKWGVRKERDPSREVRGLGPDKIEVKTRGGDTLTLSKNRPGAIVRFIGRHKPKFREEANNFASLTIKDSSGKKVGDAQLTKVNKDEINLIWLGVKRSERGKGYASATMQAAVEFGRQSGVKRLTLEVPGNSPDAKHIYEKLGFKSKGKIEDSDSDEVWGGLERMELAFDQVRHSYMKSYEFDELMSDEDSLAHFGVKGMKWGVRKGDAPGVSRKINKEASKDAQEFARAKMFYGQGAGTRRKLIKAKVETRSRQDSNYKKAFDHHLEKQDLGRHADKARGERRRKDVRANVGKNARGINRAINGPFAAPVAVAAVTAGVAFAQSRGFDRTMANAVRGAARNRNLRREVSDLLRNAASAGL